MKTKNVIEVSEWDALVEKTYGRPYKLQQQDGCRGRGTEEITVPAESSDHERDSVPENVNEETMGVSFKAWLARDPKQKLSNPEDQADYCLALWWERNFYPDVQMVANDLHAKGLLAAGAHTILIDW
ncbi:MAG: hypothetical protein IPK82_23420 [Polyangiaceae bacterium]|nr:hypothetical protein [Polyangiaceae bacterium]